MALTNRALASAVIGGVAASLLAVSPAVATAAPNTPTAATTLTRPTSMAAANGRLFVSDGNTVAVLRTDGTTQTTLTGMFGARDVLASTDGAKVYVALSQADAIAVIDTTTLSEVARYTTSPCPVHLAVGGARLFYGAGCANDWKGSIGSVDAATGTDPQTVTTDQMYTAPLLGGAVNTLVAGVPGISSGPLTTFAVSGSSATELATIDTGGFLGGVSVSPDGTKVASAAGSPYQLSQFNATTLASAGTFATDPYPRDVEYSRDGTMLGGGIDSAYGTNGNIVAFNVTSGTQVLKGIAHPKAAYNRPDVVPGTLTWAADGSRLYTLLEDSGNGDARYYLAAGFGTIPAPAATTTRLRLAPPTKPGAKVGATATVPGRPGVPVRFVRTGPAGTATVTATTNGAGVASVSIAAPSGGTVTAYYDGDDLNKASSAKATFKTVTRAAAQVSGQYKKVHGVAYFHSKAEVAVKLSVSSPVPGRKVSVLLQSRSGRAWKTVQTKRFALDRAGAAYVGFSRAAARVGYRFSVKFAGDAYGTPSSATTMTVVIS